MTNHSNITKGRIRSYRFGFNGKEKLNEQYGEGNAYDFGERIFDPRIGRWFTMDGLAGNNIPNSPYQFGLNSPISIVDKEGNDDIYYIHIIAEDGRHHYAIKRYNEDDHYRKVTCGKFHGGKEFMNTKELHPGNYQYHDYANDRHYDRYTEITIDMSGGVNHATVEITDEYYISRPELGDLFLGGGGVKVWGNGHDASDGRKGKKWPLSDRHRPEIDLSSKEWEDLDFLFQALLTDPAYKRPEPDNDDDPNLEYGIEQSENYNKGDIGKVPDTIDVSNGKIRTNGGLLDVSYTKRPASDSNKFEGYYSYKDKTGKVNTGNESK